MGRLRPSSGNGKSGGASGGKKGSDRIDRAVEPVAKRPKLAEENNEEVALEASAKHGFEALVHPMTVKTFLKQYWEMSKPVHFERGYDSLWNAKLLPSLSSKSRLTSTLSSGSQRAYFHTDVQLMGYSFEDDDLFFDTPPEGPVNLDTIWEQLETGKPGSTPSLQISNLDLFAPELAQLLKEVDAVWRGDGAVSSLLTVSQPSSSPFGVHADGQAQFILQIRGSQTVTIYSAPEAPESFIEAAGDEFAFPSMVHGPLPEIVLSREHVTQYATKTTQVELKAGSTLFIPSCVKFAQIPEKSSQDSISLTIYLSPQPRWSSSIDTILSLASSTSADIHTTDEPSFFRSRSEIDTLSSENPVANESSPSANELSHSDDDHEDGSESEEREETNAGNDTWTLFPHNFDHDDTPTAPGMRLKTLLVEVFHRAAQLVPNFVNSLMDTAAFPRHAFVDAIPELKKAIGKEGIEAKLAANGGLVKISNFFSKETAELIHQLISHVSEDDWQDAYAEQDAKENNIEHSFQSARTFPSHHALFALFKRIMPERFGDFSMGKYTESHFIAPHDDRAYKEVNGEQYSRHIAVIYYCSKDWKAEYGGQLVDMVTGQEYVPEFNSVVAFQVPRFHQVKPVLIPSVERFSIFGWFFKPGISYDLWQGDEASASSE